MSSKAYLLISGVIFGMVALAHLLRVVYQVPVHAGDWALPMWPSWAGFVGAGALWAWAFFLLRR